MLRIILTTILLLGFLATEGFSQCFTNKDCTGGTVSADDSKSCCVGTDDGFSYLEGSSCLECIVHGFENHTYSTLENTTLHTINFMPDVKGNGTRGNLLVGVIDTAFTGTGTRDDISMFNRRTVNVNTDNSAINMQIIPVEDTISLEDGDMIGLVFTHDQEGFTADGFFNAFREFLRDEVYVEILDDDSLTISFFALDFDIDEGDKMVEVEMKIREAQVPFTLKLMPTTIDNALADTTFNVTDFLPSNFVDTGFEAKATPGSDYNQTEIILMIPASTTSRSVKQVFQTVDDNINEVEQFYTIIGEIGDEVPLNRACFRVSVGNDCIGRKGATGVRIRDDDPMIIGFSEKSQTTPESKQGFITLSVDISSMRASEIQYTIGIRIERNAGETSETVARVDASDNIRQNSDALFGTREKPITENSNLVEELILVIGEKSLRALNVQILSDLVPEATECFTMSIFRSDNAQMIENFGHDENHTALHKICILDDDDPFRVGFDQTMYYVFENNNTVEVCVNLTFPQTDIEDEEVTVVVFHNSTSEYLPQNPILATADSPDIFTGDHSREPMTDFEEETSFHSTLRDELITEENRMVCYNQVIYNDLCLELTEYIGLGLDQVDNIIEVNIENRYGDSVIAIIDDDRAVVGLEEVFYRVPESISKVEICAVVFPIIDANCPNCPISFPFDVQLSTFSGSAGTPGDYGALNVTLMFPACETRRCVDVTIVDDFVYEPEENFFYTLERTPGLHPNIDLDPTLGEIVIEDDEVHIQVGYDPVVYTTSEGEGMVELNIFVFSHPVTGTPRPFTLSVTTEDGTAESPFDYGGVSGQMIQFNTGDVSRTHTISIIDDSLCETDPNEFFFSNITLFSGVPPIEIIEPQARVIINDTLEPECGIVVGYEMTEYTTPEGSGFIRLCAVVTSHNGAPRPFIISATTEDGTAVAGEDYVAVFEEPLVFARGQNRVCHDITILQDDDCEILRVEDFFSNLEYVSGVQPITIDPARARVVIDEPECDPIEVGYDPIEYRTSEGQGFVTLTIRIFEPMSGGAPRPFNLSVSTQDDTAMSPGDYVSVSGEMIQFNRGDISKTHTITIRDDSVCEEDDEQFFSNIVLVSGIPEIVVTEPRATVIIEPSDCVDTTVIVNDTLTGDPLMTVPIWTDPNIKPGDPVTSLCYEVHGEDDKYFNLISDTCVSVNAHYSKAVTGSDNIRLNIVDEIGVRAISSTGDSVDISVGLEDCKAYVNGVNMTMYKKNGIYVRAYCKNRVRIAVPNGARVDKDLVMWVFCTSGKTEDPVTWQFFNINFIRFVVMRGLNLDPTSHGIIGQFWNIPVEVSIHAGLFNGATLLNDYDITVMYPGKPERQFVGIKSSVTWEFEERDCLYVGNSQAGPLGEIVDPNDSVIEGTYDSYEVDSLFSPDYGFSRFDEEICPFF